MDARDRTLLWAIAFYVCIDALPRVASFCERVAGWHGVLPCNHACYWCGKSLESK